MFAAAGCWGGPVRETGAVSRRHPSRAPIVAAIALLAAGIGIGVLWASTEHGRQRDVARELEALRKSSAARSVAARRQSTSTPPLCSELRRQTVGTVRDERLLELSGLVQSRRDRGLLWAIQDSGAAAELVALRTNGASVGRWAVSGAENFDWEDIATGPGPGGIPWLYAADIGDNIKQREAVTIYRAPEPTAPQGGGTVAAQVLRLTYPDGAHDAESFLVDPRRGTLIVITKGVPGAVYAASRPANWGGTVPLRRIADAGIAYATAADVSADGRTIAVRGYFNVATWRRRGSEPLTATLRRPGCTSPTGLDDGQGEAIALARNGASAWTVAEGSRSPIRRLTRR